MNSPNTFMAVITDSKSGAARAAWDALDEAQRRSKEQQGMAAWKAWADQHRGSIVCMGGRLGKTKRVSRSGIADAAGAGHT